MTTAQERISSIFEAAEYEERDEQTSHDPASFSRRPEVQYIDIYSLIPNSRNRDVNMIHVSELARNIRLNGLLQYPTVSPNGTGKYGILAGEHRWHACKLNVEQYGDDTYLRMPCIVKARNEIDNELILIDTNLIDYALNPYDMMMNVGRKEELLRRKKKSGELKGELKDIIVEQSSLQRTQVQTYLTVYKKGGIEIKEALRNKRINLAQAAKLSKYLPEDQKQELEQLVDHRYQKKSKDDHRTQEERFKSILDEFDAAAYLLQIFLQQLPKELKTEKKQDLLNIVSDIRHLINAMDPEETE